jgi:hypothetical protein
MPLLTPHLLFFLFNPCKSNTTGAASATVLDAADTERRAMHVSADDETTMADKVGLECRCLWASDRDLLFFSLSRRPCVPASTLFNHWPLVRHAHSLAHTSRSRRWASPCPHCQPQAPARVSLRRQSRKCWHRLCTAVTRLSWRRWEPHGLSLINPPYLSPWSF